MRMIFGILEDRDMLAARSCLRCTLVHIWVCLATVFMSALSKGARVRFSCLLKTRSRNTQHVYSSTRPATTSTSPGNTPSIENRWTARSPPSYSVPLRTASRSSRADDMNPQHCSKPYDRDMSAQREACTFNRRIETPMIDAVLREAKEASGLPNHLVYVGPKLLTASTPPPGGFLPSIPPSGRAAMRRVVITGDNSAPNELECIRLQGNTMKEGVARARMSRTRKRDEDKENVMYDDRKSAEVDALYEIAAKLRADLKAASKKVGAKALLVRKLRDHLKGENEAADAAWSRASALEETVEKSEIAVEQASLAVAIEAAHSNDVCTRGFDVAEEITYTEWEARNDEDDAKKDAEKAKNSLKEAKEHARTREGGVVACEGLLHKAEASLAKAQRIEIYIRNSFSCASARASTFDNEQCMPKVKRVRR